MKYLNIACSITDTEQFMSSDEVTKGTWFILQCHCHIHENYGVIRGCESWPLNYWIKLGLSTDVHIRKNSSLWRWKGSDLYIELYDKDAQESHEKMVKQRKYAIKARWAKERQGKNGENSH